LSLSGYIDSWANVFNTTVDITTPSFSYRSTEKIVENMDSLPNEEMVFMLDSEISTQDTDLDLTVYTFPQLDSLVNLVRQIDTNADA